MKESSWAFSGNQDWHISCSWCLLVVIQRSERCVMFNDSLTMEGCLLLNMKDQKVRYPNNFCRFEKKELLSLDECLNLSIMFSWVSKGKNKRLLNWASSSAGVKTHSSVWHGWVTVAELTVANRIFQCT